MVDHLEENMIQLLCRNAVKDYAKWREVFDFDASAHREAGLKLQNIWQAKDNRNNVFFIFEVTDLDKAKSFINAPDAEQQATRSGVVDGEYHFLERQAAY
jgi:hypothetical protein